MRKMSLKRAKDLSEKKWKFITENNGSDEGVLKKYPSLFGMQSNCAMCYYQLDVLGSDCDTCIYTDICETEHRRWVISYAGKKELAKDVLDKIIKINKKDLVNPK